MAPKRSFLGVFFECCGAYSRIYQNADGTAYEGRCPRCLGGVKVPVGPGGTDQRFFVAYPRRRAYYHATSRLSRV